MTDKELMLLAIISSEEGMKKGAGGPFGAVIANNGEVISKSYNRVLELQDPTAHAEVLAIKEASKVFKSFDLSSCTLYTSCEPCPMCLGAIYWAKISKVFFANSRKDAAFIQFDDDFIYQELALPIDQRSVETKQILRGDAYKVFEHWMNKFDRKMY